MSNIKGDVYQRGPFWLDYVRGADGKPASNRWYIWWYDAAAGRQQRRSTRTSDVRLACAALDEHYLAAHRATPAEQESYSVHDAMTDYWVEKGQHLASAEPIRARFKLLTRFLEVERQAGRVSSPLLPNDVDERLLGRFRAWGVADPIVARKKDAAGNWVVASTRARTASTVEESIIALKAALNFAFQQRRVKYVPPLRHKVRDEVTPKRDFRLSVETLGEILDYSANGAGNYKGHGDRLLPLRRYLIAAICTLARPDAIFDMNVLPGRQQWRADEGLFDLNPDGRLQTAKRRPVMPVVPLLRSWFEVTDEWFVCSERLVQEEELLKSVVVQQGVSSVRSAWDGVRNQFGIPAGWGPKLIRHSMATILASRGVDMMQLQLALGHSVISKTSSRYVIFGPDYLGTIRAGIEDVVADLTKAAGDALHANLTQKGVATAAAKA